MSSVRPERRNRVAGRRDGGENGPRPVYLKPVCRVRQEGRSDGYRNNYYTGQGRSRKGPGGRGRSGPPMGAAGRRRADRHLLPGAVLLDGGVGAPATERPVLEQVHPVPVLDP